MQVRAVSVNCTRQLLTFTSKCPRSSGRGRGRASARNPFPPDLDSHYRSFFNSRVSLRVLVPFSFDPCTGGEAVTDKGGVGNRPGIGNLFRAARHSPCATSCDESLCRNEIERALFQWKGIVPIRLNKVSFRKYEYIYINALEFFLFHCDYSTSWNVLKHLQRYRKEAL